MAGNCCLTEWFVVYSRSVFNAFAMLPSFSLLSIMLIACSSVELFFSPSPSPLLGKILSFSVSLGLYKLHFFTDAHNTLHPFWSALLCIFYLECQLFVSLVKSFEALLLAWLALLFKLPVFRFSVDQLHFVPALPVFPSQKWQTASVCTILSINKRCFCKVYFTYPYTLLFAVTHSQRGWCNNDGNKNVQCIWQHTQLLLEKLRNCVVLLHTFAEMANIKLEREKKDGRRERARDEGGRIVIILDYYFQNAFSSHSAPSKVFSSF